MHPDKSILCLLVATRHIHQQFQQLKQRQLEFMHPFIAEKVPAIPVLVDKLLDAHTKYRCCLLPKIIMGSGKGCHDPSEASQTRLSAWNFSFYFRSKAAGITTAGSLLFRHRRDASSFRDMQFHQRQKRLRCRERTQHIALPKHSLTSGIDRKQLAQSYTVHTHDGSDTHTAKILASATNNFRLS